MTAGKPATSRISRFFSRVALAVVLIALTGCALVFSYRNLERVVYWSLDDYVDWTSAQEKELRERLHLQMQWHQRTQLPRYRAWLLTMRDALQRPVDASFLQQQADQLQSFWYDGMAQTYHDIAAQLALLSDQQTRDLIEEIRRDHVELQDEYGRLDSDELFERRSDRLQKELRYLLGSLDKTQRQRIDAWARALPDGRQQWLASRERWTDRFELALRQRHEPAVFTEHIYQLFVVPRQSWEPEYREMAEQNLAVTLQLLATLQHSLSERQHKTLEHRIDQWLGRLDTLASSL